KQFRDNGAAIITVHYEACKHLHSTLQAIKELGCKAGVAINPHTSVSLLDDVLEDLDLVLVMSVNPGFGGQKFIENTYKKIRELRTMASERNRNLLVEVGGGARASHALPLLEGGANVLVAGNAVVGWGDPSKRVGELKELASGSVGV